MERQEFFRSACTRFPIFIFLLFSVIAVSPPVSAQSTKDKIKSNIHVIVDLSDSYYRKETRARNQKVLKKTFDAVKLIQKKVSKPAIIQTFGITEISQETPTLCNLKLCRKTLFTKNKGTDCVDNPKVLEAYLSQACMKSIMSQRSRPATDIIGAIDKSVRIARSQGLDGDQTLIILSDFIEFRIKELPTPTFRLDGYHVLLVYRAQLKSDVNKEFLLPEEEVKKYASFLEKTGAQNVVYISDESADFIDAADKIH